jgi:hypothetical protein
MKPLIRWALVLLALAALAPACRDAGDDELRSSPIPAPLAAPVARTTPPAAAGAPATPPASGPATNVAPMPRTLAPRAVPALTPKTNAVATPAAPSSGTVATPPSSAGGNPPGPSRPPASPIVVLGLDVTPCDATEGEDGRGNTIPAVHPVTLDVRAEAWPGRALDPVLEIGDLRFRHYRIPVPGTLRYTAADADALPQGAQVSVRWRDDGRDRVLVTPSLQVSR